MQRDSDPTAEHKATRYLSRVRCHAANSEATHTGAVHGVGQGWVGSVKHVTCGFHCRFFCPAARFIVIGAVLVLFTRGGGGGSGAGAVTAGAACAAGGWCCCRGYLAQVDAALAVPSTVSYRLKFPKTVF